MASEKYTRKTYILQFKFGKFPVILCIKLSLLTSVCSIKKSHHAKGYFRQCANQKLFAGEITFEHLYRNAFAWPECIARTSSRTVAASLRVLPNQTTIATLSAEPTNVHRGHFQSAVYSYSIINAPCEFTHNK